MSAIESLVDPGSRFRVEPVQKVGSGSLLFVIAHIPLALLLQAYLWVSTAHALLVLSIGIIVILLDQDKERARRRVLLVASYIAASDVLWRMTDAVIFWEYSKYTIVLLLGAGFFRKSAPLRLHPLPIAYLVLLLPALALWVGEDLGSARSLVSSALSGPLCLTVAVLFCYGQELTETDRKHLLLALIAPSVAMATIALYSTLTASAIQFNIESNSLTSGGFGPVQVSSALGIGMISCWLYTLGEKRWSPRILFIAALLLWLLTQALLTFSRTGTYSGLLAIVATFPWAWQSTRAGLPKASRTLLLIVALVAIAFYAIVPRLNEFTGGTLALRYTEPTTSNRVDIAKLQLQIWRENLISGVGPGRSNIELAQVFGYRVASHSEITRLLVEHGLFGLIALLLLAGSTVWRLWSLQRGHFKVMMIAFMMWTAISTQSNGFRVAAPALLFGLLWIKPTDLDSDDYLSHII